MAPSAWRIVIVVFKFRRKKNYADRFCSALLNSVLLRILKCVLRERSKKKWKTNLRTDYVIQEPCLQLLICQSVTNQEGVFITDPEGVFSIC